MICNRLSSILTVSVSSYYMNKQSDIAYLHQDNRWITSGEYIQMSGRAGRRGKDDRGIVIQILDEQMEPDVAKNMIYGASDALFR